MQIHASLCSVVLDNSLFSRQAYLHNKFPRKQVLLCVLVRQAKLWAHIIETKCSKAWLQESHLSHACLTEADTV